MFRRVIEACGEPLQRADERGRMFQRFHGHVLRVSGAQYLAMAHVSVANIQLLGRWSSSAVERYTQQAPLIQLPNVVSQVVNQEGQDPSLSASAASSSMVPAQQPEVVRAAEVVQVNHTDNQSIQSLQGHLKEVALEVAQLKSSIVHPDEVLVFRKRSNILHRAGIDETANDSSLWRSRCGWNYGCSVFFRAASVTSEFRKCRKCWPNLQVDGVASESTGSSGASADSSSEES